MDDMRLVLGRKPGLAAIALAVAASPIVVLPFLGAPEHARPLAVRRVDAPLAAPPAPALARAGAERRRVAPAPAVPDDAGAAAAPGPCDDTEAGHRARFVAAWRTGGAARARLEREAVGLLRSARSDYERIALLRAMRDVGSPVSAELLDVALRELPDVSGPRGESVPAFVVTWLARQDALLPGERRLLEDVALGHRPHLAEPTRGRALRAWIERADDEELSTLRLVVAAQDDPLMRMIGEQSLTSRANDGQPADDHE
jgi:hypothetical protein